MYQPATKCHLAYCPLCQHSLHCAPRSVAIILVKAPVVLKEKKLQHLVGSESVPEGLILLDVSHRVNDKHHKNSTNSCIEHYSGKSRHEKIFNSQDN